MAAAGGRTGGQAMTQRLLSVEGITKKFGGLLAVDDSSLHVGQNEIVGLIGSNGAGKTTLFNVIAGDLIPTSGRVVYQGREIQSLPSHRVCRLGIARTYQIVKPFSELTVLENVMVGAFLHSAKTSEVRERALQVLTVVGLFDRRNTVGKDLNLPQLKRLELARSLATQPTLLLLDEVMSGLNPVESAKMVDLVRGIGAQGITLLIIEHVMKAIMSLSHRVYVMNQGRVIAEGKPDEVVRNPDVIKSYLGTRAHA
jgi:branched-chain amino acid transport system ATP-binding protein